MSTGSDQTGTEDQVWARLIDRIHRDEQDALLELYRCVSNQARPALMRRLGPDQVDDRIHDIYVLVTSAIRDRKIRRPECLMGYIRTLLQRTIASGIGAAVRQRCQTPDTAVEYELSSSEPSPEQELIRLQQIQWMRQLLTEMHPRDREILVRFYLYEQPREQICREMDLTETQFRLVKSRAKAKFALLGQKQLRKPPARTKALCRAVNG